MDWNKPFFAEENITFTGAMAIIGITVTIMSAVIGVCYIINYFIY